MCFCRKVMYNVNSFKGHMKVMHGYVSKKTGDKTKGWWKI
jgi:hypothetical protein